MSSCGARTSDDDRGSGRKQEPVVVGALPEKKLDEAFYVKDDGEKEKDCKDSEVKEISDMPKDHQNAEAGTFRYQYQFHQAVNKNATTVLYFPGGPGGHSIVSGEHDSLAKELEEYSVVFFDPRGVGCNFRGETGFTLRQLTTAQYAQDALRVIRELNIKNYIVYGISYGTVIATETAVAAEKAGLPPKAVVLQGVVGSTFDEKITQEMDLQFNLIMDDQPEVQKMFRANQSILGIPLADWAVFSNGYLSYSKDILKETLTTLASYMKLPANQQNPEYAADVQKMVNESLERNDVKGHLTFYMAVACREIWKNDGMVEFKIDNGRMVKSKSEPEFLKTCNQLGPKKYYDPRDFQVLAPLYYIQGTADPATPFSQAKLHSEAQSQSRKKTWLTVLGGGHSPTLAHDQLQPCVSALWRKIDSLSGFAGVVGPIGGRCPGPVIALTNTKEASALAKVPRLSK